MSGDVTEQALSRLSHLPGNDNPADLIAAQKYYDVEFTGGAISNVTLTDVTINGSETIRHEEIVNGAGNYAVASDDYVITILRDTPEAASVVLPASPATSRSLIIKDGAGNAASFNITIDGNGKDIDGAATFVISKDYESAEIIYNGTEWNVIGSYEPDNAMLEAIAALSSTGLITRTGSGTAAARTLTGTANQVTVTNGNGVSGNPTLSLPQDIGTSSSVQFSNVTLNSGGALRGTSTPGGTLLIQARDVDGAAYTTFITLTANNTPTCDLSDSVTKAGGYIYRAGGTDVPVTDGGTGASDAAGALASFGLNTGLTTTGSWTLDATGGAYDVNINVGDDLNISVEDNVVIESNNGNIQLGALNGSAQLSASTETLIESQTDNVRVAAEQGQIQLGSGTLATNATVGHVWIPSCAGVPTGTPGVPAAGAVALIYNSSANTLYVYEGGAWNLI
jgi:hypothetical protein